MYSVIVLFPLFSFFFSFFFSKLIGSRGTWFLNFFAIFLSLVFSIDYLFIIFSSNFSFSHTISIFPYFSFFGGFDFSWSLKFDFISSFILFLICLISVFIQIFSSTYMQNDVSFSRFILYISFFSFSILLLVSASSFLVLFAGWEIVGLASVLLINFWFNRQEANWGAFKAFSFNRVGDAALIFSFAIFFFVCSSTDFDIIEIFLINPLSSNYHNFLFIAFFFVFLGAFAKSAQFFFHSWLPDAMEGPTPVSALLHSATMVTAGVYVSIRCFFAVAHYPFFQTLLCFFGLLTSFYSAFVLTTVNNSKHTTAYTTLNQLGFIFYAVGSLVFSTALFHLIVHGFYKSFTFLENAIELSNVDDEQEGSVFFLNTNFFETVYDFLGFIVFISVNALPFSSPSVSKELLVFSGFENFSNFVSFLLLSTLFIGFIDSCYDDNQIEYSSGLNYFQNSFSGISIFVPFPIFFSYFCLAIMSFLVVFFSEEVFLNLAFYFSDFYFFSLQTNGSFLIFVPFFLFISTSFFFPTFNTFFNSSDFSFKTFISNIFFYDNFLINRFIASLYLIFLIPFSLLDRGFLEFIFIKVPIKMVNLFCSFFKNNSFFSNVIWPVLLVSIFVFFIYL
jgi:NADH:ubiquinone oxidoreductase subunit 5 (subunit L)/multisubunit Na+/H+ antiporter MnhA subunit